MSGRDPMRGWWLKRPGLLFFFLLALFAFAPSITRADAVEAGRLVRTIAAAKANMSPADDARVAYDPEAREIRIAFTTLPSYIESEDDPYARWRHNQWAVLQEFKLAKIPVDWVTVETNLLNGEGMLRYRHTAEHVDKYADLRSDGLWRRTGRRYLKKVGSKAWERVR